MSTLHLTFDDGPSIVWTPQVLSLLAARRAQATFFVLGARMREQPHLVPEILAAGHRVELHGDAHLDHRTASSAALEHDTATALDALAGAGVTPSWWRLPWGRPGPATSAVAEQHGLRIVGWDADTHDWRGDTWQDQPAGVRSVATRGGIVLLHDAIGPGAPRSGCGNTLKLADALIGAAADADTPVAPLPDPAAPGAHDLTITPPRATSLAAAAHYQGAPG